MTTTRPSMTDLQTALDRAQRAAGDQIHRETIDRTVHLVRSAAATTAPLTLTPRQVHALAIELDGIHAARRVRSLAAEQAAATVGAPNVVPFSLD